MEMPDSLQPRVIVVDDDDVIRELVIEQLSREALDVVPAGDLATLQALLAEAPADLIILDLTLPDGDGLNLCRELRANGRAEAIMMVTARGSAIDRVLGLELGADDYLTKPFEPRELVARVRNLLRRVRPEGGAGASALRYACFGAWRLDRFHHRLEGVDRRVVMLSAAEFKLLSRFIENPTVVLSRGALLPERAATVAFDRTLDIQISRLRQKLVHPDQEEELILTVRSEGYMFTTPVRYE